MSLHSCLRNEPLHILGKMHIPGDDASKLLMGHMGVWPRLLPPCMGHLSSVTDFTVHRRGGFWFEVNPPHMCHFSKTVIGKCNTKSTGTHTRTDDRDRPVILVGSARCFGGILCASVSRHLAPQCATIGLQPSAIHRHPPMPTS